MSDYEHRKQKYTRKTAFVDAVKFTALLVVLYLLADFNGMY